MKNRLTKSNYHKHNLPIIRKGLTYFASIYRFKKLMLFDFNSISSTLSIAISWDLSESDSWATFEKDAVLV